jgi:hypothetical protein
MANFQVPDKSSIGAVDGAADKILVYDTSAVALKSATRDVFLNITSQPLGLTDTQSPTNKTLGNTNTVTLKDTLFTLQDDGDTTKQAKFQLSGITTGTTRTYTLPDASSTLMDLASAQTVSGVKTMTSPVLNTPTITNPTITVDTISEYTSANGVQIDGVKLKDGALATNNSVVTTNITDSAVTPAKLLSGAGSSWTWQTWAVAYTNFTLGNGGTVYAKYTQIGKTIHFRLQFFLGSTSAVSGIIGFSLPVTANADLSDANDFPLCAGQLADATGSRWNPAVAFGSTARLDIYYWNNSNNLTNTSSTAPFTWATNDLIAISGTYEMI